MRVIARLSTLFLALAGLALIAAVDGARAQQGITAETVTPELMTKHGLLAPFGAMVTGVERDTPAAAAGLAPQDVIIAVGTTRVLTADDLAAALDALKPGTRAELIVMGAGGASRRVAITPAPPERGYAGINVQDVTAEEARALGLPDGQRGTRATGAVAGGPAATAGVTAGDVIVELDGRPVVGTNEFIAAIGALGAGRTARLTVIRKGERVALAVRLGRRPAELDAQKPSEPVLMLDTGGHMGLIRGLAFTADGQHIVSASDDKVVRIWEWATGRTVATLRGEVAPGDEGKIFAMALSPGAHWGTEGGRGWLAVGGWMKVPGQEGQVIRLYDLSSGRLVRLLRGHSNIVQSLAFAPTVRGASDQPPLLASGSWDRTAIVWSAVAGPGAEPLLHRLQGHTEPIHVVDFSPDGRRVVSAGDDNTLKLWDVASGKLLETMTGHGAQLRALAVSPRDGTVASGDRSGEIRLWNGMTGSFLKAFRSPSTGVGALAFSPDGSRLLSTSGTFAGKDIASVWEIASGRSQPEYTAHDSIVLAASISPDGRLATTAGGYDFPIHVWDLVTGERRRSSSGQPLALAGTGRPAWAAGFSTDGHSIAWGSTDVGTANSQREPYEFQLRLPTVTQRLGVPQPVAPADAARSNAWRRASPSFGDMRLNHRPSQGMHARPDGILDITRNGRTIASIERVPAEGYRHRAYTFTPDGRNIVSGGANGVLTAYDLDGKKLGNFIGHEGDVWAVTPSPDGRYLVSGSNDQTVRLWNLATRELIVTLFHGSDGEWVMWTPQGYYTGSPRAGDIVGWQQNYGPDNAARYVRGGTLRHMLRRPDIVERAIVLADAAAAVKELATGGPALAELVRRPPPELWLRGDPTTATGRARLVLEVERTGRPVTAFDVHLGAYDNTGRFVPERRLVHRPVPVPAGYKPQFPERELRAFEVDLREGPNLLAVVARTDIGETTTVPTQVVSRANALGTQDGALRVLAIGIDKYPDASPYPGNLAFAGKDAREFAETARRTMGRRHERVEIEQLCNGCLIEPTKANIELALRRLSRAGPKDTIVLFIAGHGESRRGQYVVLPTDHRRSRADDAGEVVVEWKTIRDALANAPGRRIVFLDTCHAGNAYNDALSGDARSFGLAAFTAAQAGYIAGADDKLQQGRFTHALRLGLGGEAMRNDSIEVYDLGSYLSRKVRELSNGAQEAEFFPGAGNFVLVGP